VYLCHCSTETKAAAHAVGFNQENWDGDWCIQDFPIEHKSWDDLTDEEMAGATHFGYTRITWDETGETEFEDDGSVSVNSASRVLAESVVHVCVSNFPFYFYSHLQNCHRLQRSTKR
jgi:hypothetical protein